MSFIYNYFTSNNASPEELENAAAVKAMLKDRKAMLKTECKQYESEYKKTLKDAEAEYERAKMQAKETLYKNIIDAVQVEFDGIMATDAYINSDPKTKSKIEGFKSWMTCAATSSTHCCKSAAASDGKVDLPPSYTDEKKPELISIETY
ncbi:hypothetical protein BGZ76_003005 [Entomortierella beljakovae]|nr:hypothetical protein BGZ76_003005 [Entomortierella beljakovae]